MCRFLTFATRNIPPLECGAGEIEPFENQGSGHVYPPGMQVFCITHGGCSCDIVMTSSDAHDPVRQMASLRERYKKKGWSGSKIERAIRDANRSKNKMNGLSSAVAAYFTQLQAKVGEVQFIVHQHSAGFATEPFEILETVVLSTVEGKESFCINEDVRYVLRMSGEG